MNETKHTPVPWQIVVDGQERMVIHNEDHLNPDGTYGMSSLVIAKCGHERNTVSESNARLIAESPVMFQLLQEIIHDNRVPIKYAERALEIALRVDPID